MGEQGDHHKPDRHNLALPPFFSRPAVVAQPLDDEPDHSAKPDGGKEIDAGNHAKRPGQGGIAVEAMKEGSAITKK